MTRCIVTGGGGFVGKALSLRLRALGHEVVSLSRSFYGELERHGIRSERVDLSDDFSSIEEHFVGVDLVFHVAAKVDMWGRRADFYKINVQGTENVIRACQSQGVRRLVYTSSPSVIADGTDLKGVDESYPYPKHHKAYYPETKAIAERSVLAANGETLRTCALRPHLIWGPGDTNLLPTIIERARAGRLIQVGEGKNRVDLSFIEDCVEAHINAADTLNHSESKAPGRVYFISQGEPVVMWDWINEVLKRNDIPPIERTISFGLADRLARVSELLCRINPFQKEPLLTRFLVSEMATDHYFSIDAARRDLGYQPRYSIAEALELTFPRLAIERAA